MIITLIRDYVDYNLVWHVCYPQLYKNAIIYMNYIKKPLMVRIGCEFTIYKLKEIHEKIYTIFR